MKKFTLTIFALFLLTVCLNAQPKYIAVQLGDNVSFYTNLDSAIVNAPSGADIYIPGGLYPHNSYLLINKKLNLNGVGHYPIDGANVTKTTIEGDLKFITGADSCKITGIHLNVSIRFGTISENDAVNDVIISRCNLHSIELGYTDYAPYSNNVIITENVLRNSGGGNYGIHGHYCSNILIHKNILAGPIGYLNQNVIISNNVFLGYYEWAYPYFPLHNVSFSLIKNNIFNYDVAAFNNVYTNTIRNNVFKADITEWGDNLNQFNILAVPAEQIFVNQSGTAFSYDHNYQLVETSPGKNAGTDGTDVGIYGTLVPYKTSAIPSNPKVLMLDVNEQGNTLFFNSSVEAQQR